MDKKERSMKFFGDIISEDRINAPRVIPVEDNNDELLNEILWDAFNGRGKYVSAPIEKDTIVDDYYVNIEDGYIDWGKEIDKALESVNIK